MKIKIMQSHRIVISFLLAIFQYNFHVGKILQISLLNAIFKSFIENQRHLATIN